MPRFQFDFPSKDCFPSSNEMVPKKDKKFKSMKIIYSSNNFYKALYKIFSNIIISTLLTFMLFEKLLFTN
ncbi:hypothetical protein BpHYR1_046403 [Brachionus plicatilis]|uniref:Uncharacterized protein n=1 Tax=Brachionus plicatilis TaxID=10195 RepID=A0A3M7RI48_BRAPC|nr:hypothetical protein BpHYR1_046403 [Brachionus plicatilis]